MSPTKQTRIKVDYTNYSNKFLPPKNNFTKQYYCIYNARISAMRKFLVEKIKNKWGDTYPLCKLGEIRNYDGPCVVTGTIFKEQVLKPSLLREISEESQLVPQPIIDHYTSDSDQLVLEDELQRINLYGDILNVHDIVTGVPCGILGIDKGIGKFQVMDYVFAGISNYIERPLMIEDCYIVFTSGLDLSNQLTSELSIQLFIDWVIGLFNFNNEKFNSSKICRVVIAGNLLYSNETKHLSKVTKNKIKPEDKKELLQSLQLLDKILKQLVKSVNVDIMCGEYDPSNYMMPQQPLHPCMLTETSQYTSLNAPTNPYLFEINGFRILGTSGQPIKDIKAFSDIESSLDCLEKCIQWGHMCPTAPDTLPCYPFYDNDPFIINKCPHVFFAGCQNKFDTKLYKDENGSVVRLVSIPEFWKTNTACVVNLKNLECYPISFNVES